jgi:hypothetical protein
MSMEEFREWIANTFSTPLTEFLKKPKKESKDR